MWNVDQRLLLSVTHCVFLQYAGHRFCNGPVYSEYMAQDLLLPLVSYGKLSLVNEGPPRVEGDSH